MINNPNLQFTFRKNILLKLLIETEFFFFVFFFDFQIDFSRNTDGVKKDCLNNV